jgi:uncharacterized membrane protein
MGMNDVRGMTGDSQNETPLEILKKRFALREITKEEL